MSSSQKHLDVFVTGATGYLAKPLIPRLLSRGHRVFALARPGSEGRVPTGATVVIGQALDPATWARHVPRHATLVHLIGTPHPGPHKAKEFEAVDRVSVDAAVAAAKSAGVARFVYLSIAHPAPMMHAYIRVREAGEAAIRASGIPAVFVRPWYVLGPGHWWPLALVPGYWLGRLLPWTREIATRLSLVTLPQMTRALVGAIENPIEGPIRIVDVPMIRAS